MTTRARSMQTGADRLLTRSTPVLEPAELLAVPGLQTRGLTELTVRAAAADDGTFEGYACVWDVVDSYGTTFRQGSFVEGGLDQSEYALLWMHNPSDPIGVFTAREDDHGLLIAGSWDDTTNGRDARVRAARSAPGLSVGFVPIGVDPNDDSVFTSARLVETSQITLRMASVPGASITKARAASDEAARRAEEAIALLRLSIPVAGHVSDPHL